MGFTCHPYSELILHSYYLGFHGTAIMGLIFLSCLLPSLSPFFPFSVFHSFFLSQENMKVEMCMKHFRTSKLE